MRRKLTAMTLLALTLALSASALMAQGGGRAGGRMGRPAGPPPGGDSAAPNRAQMEQQVQQRLGQMLKNRLGLNADQMKKLRETNQRYDEKRRVLVDQERDVRMSMRDEVLRPDTGRRTQVTGLLDRMIKVQRQRVDLMEQEQGDLAKFLTPMQRVQYFGLEENVRRRMQQMRQQQMGGRAGRMGQQMDPNGMPMQPGMQGRGGRGRAMQPMDSQGGPPPNQLRPRKRLPPPDTTGGVPGPGF